MRVCDDCIRGLDNVTDVHWSAACASVCCVFVDDAAVAAVGRAEARRGRLPVRCLSHPLDFTQSVEPNCTFPRLCESKVHMLCSWTQTM